MSEQADGDILQEERIGEVLGGYLAAVEAGEAPSAPSCWSAYPELAGELAAFFAQQERFALLVAPLRAAAEAARTEEPTNADADATMPPALGSQAPSGDQPRLDPGETAALPRRPIGVAPGVAARRRHLRWRLGRATAAASPGFATSATTRFTKSSAAAAWASSTRPGRSASTGPSPSR